MNKLPLLFALCAFLALCVMTPLTSCVSARADRVALFDPAQLAWPAVADDYNRGILDGTDNGRLDQLTAELLWSYGEDMHTALESGNRAALRLVPWPTMAPWASDGIDAKLEAGAAGEPGGIGPGVAKSLREQLANFTVTITRLRGL